MLTALALIFALPAQAGTVPGTSCKTFPGDSWWHADISALPKHSRSAKWMLHMDAGPGSTRKLHPDFGPSFGDLPGNMPYGIPITVVGPNHAKLPVQFQYDDESDNVRYPLGADTRVEGGQYQSGDRHTVIVDRGTCRLYETWATGRRNGRWIAGSGATWSLKSYKLRPDGWTSADAAGLPILPLLLRLDEVRANTIDHAIRFTAETTDKRYVWPARHEAGSVNDQRYPPMGARFRLKASYIIKPSLRADTKRVLAAMKTYGLVLADNGSDWYFQGTSEPGWPNALLDELKQVPANAFEAVDTSSLMINPNSMKTPPPM
jgi:hypothetical protein